MIMSVSVLCSGVGDLLICWLGFTCFIIGLFWEILLWSRFLLDCVGLVCEFVNCIIDCCFSLVFVWGGCSIMGFGMLLGEFWFFFLINYNFNRVLTTFWVIIVYFECWYVIRVIFNYICKCVDWRVVRNYFRWYSEVILMMFLPKVSSLKFREMFFYL